MKRSKNSVSPRKKPKQARSVQMQKDIIEASIRVLKKEGPLNFTTKRVADQAGISVGSLYQYYPNKQALAFAVQEQYIAETWRAIQIEDDEASTAVEQLRTVVRAFFDAERQIASELGDAAGGVAMLVTGAPNAELRATLRRKATSRMKKFLFHTGADFEGDPAFIAEFMVTTILTMAKASIARSHNARQCERYADATASMLAAYAGITEPPD